MKSLPCRRGHEPANFFGIEGADLGALDPWLGHVLSRIERNGSGPYGGSQGGPQGREAQASEGGRDTGILHSSEHLDDRGVRDIAQPEISQSRGEIAADVLLVTAKG